MKIVVYALAPGSIVKFTDRSTSERRLILARRWVSDVRVAIAYSKSKGN